MEEQNLWKQFDNSDIYEFITGEQDTLPEFQYDWIEPCQPAVHFPPGVLLAAQQNRQPQQAPPAQPVAQAAPPAQPAQVVPRAQPMPPAQLALPQNQQVVQFQQVPDQAPVAGPSGYQQPVHQQDLRPRQELDYKELHTGIKQRCQKKPSPSKSSCHKAGSRIIFTQTSPTMSIFSKHGEPRAIILTCAILWSCFLQLSKLGATSQPWTTSQRTRKLSTPGSTGQCLCLTFSATMTTHDYSYDHGHQKTN